MIHLSSTLPITYYTGISGIKEMYRLLMKSWKPKDEYLIASAPLDSFLKLEKFFINEVHRKRIKDRVEMKILINRNAEKFSFARKSMPHTEVRFLDIHTEIEYGVLNNMLFLVSYGKKPYAILVRDRSSAETFRSYFDIMWNQGRTITIPPLITSTKPLKEILQEYLSFNPVIVTDPHNYKLARTICATVNIRDSSYRNVAVVKKIIAKNKANLVLGLGGCTALDVARACATSRVPSVMIPTILSTVCISIDRSVFIYKNARKSFHTQSPQAVIHSLPVLRATDPLSLKRWSQSGFGDLFAKFGAAIDVAHREAKRTRGRVTFDQIRREIPETFEALEWVLTRFKRYGEYELDREAVFLHDASVSIILQGGFSLSGGAEHDLAYAIEKIYQKKHATWPTHGQIVSIGTLIQTKLLGDMTNDHTLYDRLKKAYKKLGLPITYAQMKQLNISKSYIVAGIRSIRKLRTFMSCYSSEAINVLDDIF